MHSNRNTDIFITYPILYCRRIFLCRLILYFFLYFISCYFLMDSTGSHQVFRYLSAIYQDVFYTMHTRYKIHTTIHKYLDTCCNPIEAFILLLYIQLYIIEKFVSSPFLSGYAVPCISIRTLNVLQSEPLR